MVAREDDNQVAVLEEALTRWVDEYVRGEAPDVEEFIRQYPGHEARIRRRIGHLREIDGLFDSLGRADESDFASAVPAHELIGSQIGSFQLEKVIGRGGMGVVYLARDTKLKRLVALKSLPPGMLTSVTAQSRFRREAEVLASLNHPNIGAIYDIIEHQEGVTFLVLEYVPGETLAARMAKAPLALEEILSLSHQIADAIASAHAGDVVHRDLKPGNIMITPEERVKVLDFGLAKATGPGPAPQCDRTTATEPGRLMGTPAYMSPEQVRGKETDLRTDIWSFGCVLYEMVTQRRPFEGETTSDTIARTLEREPDWDVLPGFLPVPLRELMQRCLQKEPADRLQQMKDAVSEIKTALNACGDKPIQADLQTLRLNGPSRILRTVTLAAIPILAILLVFGGRLPWGRVQSSSDDMTLVVLPFDNLGPAEDAYLAAGITEAIRTRLTSVRGLAITSPAIADYYAKSNESIEEVGRELGVDYVLKGTLLRERPSEPNSTLRVIPTLLRTADGRHIWAEPYESSMAEVFAVQADLSERVARALDVTLLASEPGATRDAAAYDRYLRGNDYVSRGCYQEQNARIALRMYQEAVELDPAFAQAWAQLGCVHTNMYWYRHDRSDERLDLAKVAIEMATQLAPDHPDTHRALGIYYYWGLLDYDLALEHCAAALKGRPNDSILYVITGSIKRRQGDLHAALSDFEEASRLDPHGQLPLLVMAATHMLLHAYPQATDYFERAIAANPEIASPYGYYIKMLLARHGNTEAARAVLNQALEYGQILDDDHLTYHAVQLELLDGAFDEALRILDSVDSEIMETELFAVSKAQLRAQIHHAQGDDQAKRENYDAARRLLETELEKRPNDAFLNSALGIAYAGLGHKNEAVQRGKRAVELLPITKEAWAGTLCVENLARIYVTVDEFDLAIDLIEHLLSIPGELSVPLLQLDPVWDPLHDHPRFKQLVKTKSAENRTLEQ